MMSHMKVYEGVSFLQKLMILQVDGRKEIMHVTLVNVTCMQMGRISIHNVYVKAYEHYTPDINFF